MKTWFWAIIMAIEALVLVFWVAGASLRQRQMLPAITANRQLAHGLMLTDLALWTEARYARHPSQADDFAPFQDFPGAIEHFPAGAIVPPSSMGRRAGQNRLPAEARE